MLIKMVQNNLEMHQYWQSLLEILKTMLEKHEHSFFISDLSLLSKTYAELSFYNSVSLKANIPKGLSDFLAFEKDDSLYYLSSMLDKYSLEENDLQKLITQFEELKTKIIQ
jgi:hypothetical protein